MAITIIRAPSPVQFDSSLGRTPGFGTRIAANGETEPIGNGSGQFTFWSGRENMKLKHLSSFTDTDGEIHSDCKLVGKLPFGGLIAVGGPSDLPHPPPAAEMDGPSISFKPFDEKISVVTPPPTVTNAIDNLHGKIPFARRSKMTDGRFIFGLLGYARWDSNLAVSGGANELNQEYKDFSITDPFDPITPSGILYSERGHILRAAVTARVSTLAPPPPGNCTLAFLLGNAVAPEFIIPNQRRDPPFYAANNAGEFWRIIDFVTGTVLHSGSIHATTTELLLWPGGLSIRAAEVALLSAGEPIAEVSCDGIFPSETQLLESKGRIGGYPV